MKVDLASSVSKKFRSKHAFLTCVTKLYDKGVRAKHVEDHPVLELGLYLCHDHFVHRTWYDFRGSLEKYIRTGVADCVAEAQSCKTTLSPEYETLAQLFQIKEEEVAEPENDWMSVVREA